MSREPYQYVPMDPDGIVEWLREQYEAITGLTIRPGSPERQFIQWVAMVILQERVLENYIANQNIPSRASGKELDALAELFYAKERPEATASSCTMRFYISEAQAFPVLVPKGTRITDTGKTVVWETVEDVYVQVGDTSADVKAVCQTKGAAGNGFAVGQIDSIVDLFAYFIACENVTETDGGANTATDEEFFELLKASMDGYSCAGARGSYIYFAKQVSTEIADVAANSPSAGKVSVYVLMADGKIAGDEMKAAVLEACNREDRRPLTDYVAVADPELVNYDITLTYYIKENATVSSTEIQEAVDSAVKEYVAWQCGKLGRDINPDELRERIRAVGNIKRVDLTSPVFTMLKDGKEDGEVPQVAKVETVTVTNGGFEDE